MLLDETHGCLKFLSAHRCPRSSRPDPRPFARTRHAKSVASVAGLQSALGLLLVTTDLGHVTDFKSRARGDVAAKFSAFNTDARGHGQEGTSRRAHLDLQIT